MCIDFEGHHSGGSSFVNENDFCYYRNCCVTTGTSLALRKNRSMRVPVYSLVPRTRFGSAIRVGSGLRCDKMCFVRSPLIYSPLICVIHAALSSYNTVGLFLIEDNPHDSLMCCIIDLNQTHSLLASCIASISE